MLQGKWRQQQLIVKWLAALAEFKKSNDANVEKLSGDDAWAQLAPPYVKTSAEANNLKLDEFTALLKQAETDTKCNFKDVNSSYKVLAVEAKECSRRCDGQIEEAEKMAAH